jgi:hypothetical protein
MTIESIELEKHLKKATVYTNFVSAFVAAILAIGVGYGFYYNTSNTLNRHSEDINEVKQDVSKIKNDIQEVDIFKGVSEIEVKTLEEKIIKLEENVVKMDDKLDKILIQTRK